MNTKVLKTQILPALLFGTGRQPLKLPDDFAHLLRPDDSKAALHALSLTAQALRFERPLPPPDFVTEITLKDERAILPEHLRRPLLRLLNGKKGAEPAVLALAWAFGRLRLRLHPFDLPKLDTFVRAHAECLGLTAQHWAQQRADAAAPEQGYFDADEIEDATWTEAPLARRARFLQERRRQNADGARAMLEVVWTQESADARFGLLAALQTGLCAADQPFLESLAKDRAPRVRTLAERLLASLPGHVGVHPALQACLSRIQLTSTGLLKKRAVLKLELPATVRDFEIKGWIAGAFAEVGCDELARSFGLSEEEMMEAAAKDEKLLLAFALMLTRDRRLDLLEVLVSRYLPDAWEQMSQCGMSDIGLMVSEERLRWAEILIRPYIKNPWPSLAAWSWMQRLLEGPIPESMMDPLLSSSSWKEFLQDDKKLTSDWIEIIASLCPASLRGNLRTRIAPLDPTLTVVALPLLDILDAMESGKL